MDSNLQGAISDLRILKEEHRKLMAMISGDPGMDPATRQALVDHILEEEEEHLAEMAAASGGSSASVAGAAPMWAKVVQV